MSQILILKLLIHKHGNTQILLLAATKNSTIEQFDDFGFALGHIKKPGAWNDLMSFSFTLKLFSAKGNENDNKLFKIAKNYYQKYVNSGSANHLFN